MLWAEVMETSTTINVPLIVPLLGGHSFSMWTEFMVVDCLVLLFVGGLVSAVSGLVSLNTTAHTQDH